MIDLVKRWLLRVFLVSTAPPHEPAGAHESVQIVRASPRYFHYLLVQWAVGMAGTTFAAFAVVTAGAVGLAAAHHPGLGLLVVVAGLAFVSAKLLFFYVTTRIDYEMRWYVVTDRSLRIRSGVFSMREVTLTYANVQNLRIDQGPLQRYFGIADLVVLTAGGGAVPGVEAHQGLLRGIEDAPAVREKIQALLRAYKLQGLGDPDEPHDPPPAHDELGPGLQAVRDEVRALRQALCGPPGALRG